MKFGSLFSGIGGFDLGFQREGFDVRWCCEIEPFPVKVLERRFPGVPVYPDVTTLKGADLEPVDVLVGGFPCQDVSVAGQRAGLGGARSGLFYQLLRLAEELRPEWVVIENVPGLLSSHQGRDFHAVLSALADSGFRRAYRILDSQYFRIAQRRRRVFLVLRARGFGGGPEAVLLESQGGGRDSEKGRKARTGAAACLRGRSHGVGVASSGETARALVGSMFKCHDDDTDTLIAHTLHGNGLSVIGVGVRRLTPLECERLQGFPDGWTCLCGVEPYSTAKCTCGDSARYRALGNAVTVNVAQWIARRLRAVMEATA
jgi:DNA (cytosine-5)-methyltransferase 1